MNISYELDKLHEINNHIEVLENTNSKHPFTLWKVLYDWKHKALVKEQEIVDWIKRTKL